MRIITLIAVVLILTFTSCKEEENIDCGKTLTWKAEEGSAVLKAVAGEKCSNYSDYYDADLNQIITKIQSMKFVLNRKCYELTSVDSDPEEIEVACPEFVPETIEFGEIVKCSFGTPPAENTNCMADPINISFKMGTFSENANWMFDNVENPRFVFGASSSMENRAFSASKDDVCYMSGYFNDETLTSATIVFTWTEDEEEKTLEFSAVVVETKE